MSQFGQVLLAVDQVQTVPQMALICRSGLAGLNQIYGPNHPTIWTGYDQ